MPHPQAITQYRPAEGFTLNDLRHWVWAYDQFIGDVRDLVADPANLPEQVDLDRIADKLDAEFVADCEHQRYWWLHYDRAAEALPLLESDGPEHYNHSIEGFGSGYMDYDKIREGQTEEAYINLVGSNVDRKMGDLSGFKPNFFAEPVHRDHQAMIRALNEWVKDIKDNTDFSMHWNRFKYEMITLGSGVMKIGHGVNWHSSEFAMFKNFIRRRDKLTMSELRRFEDVFRYHDIRYIPSFQVVRFRGANGPQSISLQDPVHRQLHHFEHVGVAEARNRYPEYAHKIQPNVHQKALEMSPHLAQVRDEISDMVTLIHHRVKYPVRETIQLPVEDAQGNIQHFTTEKPRYATGRITVAHGCGVVDMDLDYYDHSKLDMVQGVNFPSSKHGCGIGMVKFGRDPAIMHNKLHNGALRYFGRQIKGGGFVLDEIISDDDLSNMSKGNRWVKIDPNKVKPYINREKGFKLSDFIMDNRPPAFPAAWANLMKLEEEALDRSMRAGGAWRGERVGYSGLQQSIASQDAGLMHTNTHDILRYTVKEMSDIVFSNVVQFDGDRPIKFTRKNEFGDREEYELNQPMFPVAQYDWAGGDYKMVPSYIKNHIGTMQFITRIEPESIVPERPLERTQFFIQMLQFMYPYIQSMEGRILLRGFQAEGMRIPSMGRSLDQIDELEKERLQLNAQLQELQQEYDKMRDDREWAKDKAEANQNLLRLTQKFVGDLASANPNTLQAILSGQYPQVQQDFIGAIKTLLQGSGGAGGQPPTIEQMREQGGPASQDIAGLFGR